MSLPVFCRMQVFTKSINHDVDWIKKTWNDNGGKITDDFNTSTIKEVAKTVVKEVKE